MPRRERRPESAALPFERKAVQAVAGKHTVGSCIDQFIVLKAATWSASTLRQWRPSRLTTPALLAKPSEEVTKLDIIEALRVRTRVMKPRVQKKLERLFDWAIVRGYRAEPNPAQLKLADYFELAKHKTKHHPPMPWRVLPEFLRWLRTKEDLPACCLEFQILTCVRIPENRMKMGNPHLVPLSPPTLALLRRLFEIHTSPLIFPSRTNGKMSAGAVSDRIPNDRWLTPSGEKPHVHGFRGAFVNWSAEHDLSYEVTERCLAHGFGNATTRAYRQTDLLDRRREMLKQWADFLDGPAL